MLWRALFALMGIVAGNAYAAPSFNCHRATSLDEIAICASPALSNLEQRFADAFKAASQTDLVAARNVARNIRSQRQACGADTTCLAKVLNSGISRLSGREIGTTTSTVSGSSLESSTGVEVFGIRLGSRRSDLSSLGLTLKSDSKFRNLYVSQNQVPIKPEGFEDYEYRSNLYFDDNERLISITVTISQGGSIEPDLIYKVYRGLNTAVAAKWRLVEVDETPQTVSAQSARQQDYRDLCGDDNLYGAKIIDLMRRSASNDEWRFMDRFCQNDSDLRYYRRDDALLAVQMTPKNIFNGEIVIEACVTPGATGYCGSVIKPYRKPGAF